MNETEYLEMCRTEWPKVVDENANLRMKIEAMEWCERKLGDEMVKQTLRADELKEHLAIWIERAEKAESEAAAMREVLEGIDRMIELGAGELRQSSVQRALASTAGADLLARLHKAEADRVELYKPRGYCQTIKCGTWLDMQQDVAMRQLCYECPAYHFHQYLRDHGMIREAE